MGGKELLTLLSPMNKLSKVAEKVEEKVELMYELNVQNLKNAEVQVSELSQQTVILKDIRAILKNGEKKSKDSKDGDQKMGSFDGLKKLDKGTIGIAALAMLSIGAAIVATAFMFSLIPALSPMQIVTAIAISVAFIPMAIAFVKIASILQGMKGTTKANIEGIPLQKTDGSGIFQLAAGTLISMLGVSAAIVATSWLMKLILPVSGAQLVTAIAIAIAFVPMAMAFGKISKVLLKMKGVTKAGIQGMPFQKTDGSGIFQLAGGVLMSMIGMSAAITASSWLFRLILPVSGAQLMTAIGISLAFIGLSYAYAKVAVAINRIKSKNPINIGGGISSIMQTVGTGILALVGFTAAVAISSWVMQLIMPVHPIQLLTALAISVIFIPAAYAYVKISKALKNLKGGKTGIGPGNIWQAMGVTLLSMVGIAAALTLSSMIMQLIMPVQPVQLLTALAIAVIMIPAAFAFGILSKSLRGTNIKNLLFTTAGVALIAIGLVAAAWVFTYLPSAFNAPPWEWTLKTGLALVVFGAAFVALAYTVGKLPIKDILFGVIGVAAVAIAILATAWIFSILPSTYLAPDIGWSLSAMVSIILFAIPVGIIGAIIMATGGTGLAAVALGVIGMIIIAAGILAIAWIFSYIPAGKLASVAKGLTEAILAPMNGIVDVLVRIKNELGVETLIPLAVGIIAISVSLMALAGATAGVAAGGLLSSVANVGKAFFDGVAGFFGAEKSKGPMDILEDLVRMGPRIITLSEGMDLLAGSLGRVIGYATLGNIEKINKIVDSVILTDMGMQLKNGFSVSEYFTAYPKFLHDVAKGYDAIKIAQSGMNVEILDKTTEMVKALAYLNEVGGDNAMAKLGESLVKAVGELSEMIKNFGGSVDAQTESGQKTAGALEGVAGKLKNLVGVGGSSSSGQSPVGNFDSDEIVSAIEDLQRIIKNQKSGGLFG